MQLTQLVGGRLVFRVSLSLSLSLLCFSVWFACPVSVAGFPWRVGGCLCFVFCFSLLFSLSAVKRLAGRLLLSLSLCVRWRPV